MFGIVGRNGLAGVIDDKGRLINQKFGHAGGHSRCVEAQYRARRYAKDHRFAARVFDEGLQVFNLAFFGEGEGVTALAPTTPVVIIDREVSAKEFSHLRTPTLVEATIGRRATD